MSKVAELLNQSLDTARKMKRLLFLVAGIYVVSFLAGYLMVHFQVPFAMELSKTFIESVSANPVFTPIIGSLMSGNLALAIAFTFLLNLSVGAFVYTTLIGVIPILGGVGSVAVTGLRGFIIGLTYYYAFGVSIGYTVVALGTLILELGAYVFSAAAGINISLSAIFPRRYGVESRWAAFKMAWKDAAKIYLIVVILLVLGAVWEMAGIYIAMH